MPSPGTAHLERWSQRHALAMLAGLGVAGAVGHPWPLAAIAVCTFSALLRQWAGAWTPRGRFGWANAVTALRLGITLALPCWHGAPGVLLLGALVLVLMLDGLDGWIARRTEEASDFGAHFDMETDALLVMLVDVELWLRGSFGAWILTAGVLRYLYVLFVAVAPGSSAPMPRWRWARYAFVALLIGLGAGLALPNAVGAVAAALGTAAVTASFARSFYWSYRAGTATQAVSPGP